MNIKKLMTSGIIFILIILPVFTIAFLDFSSLHAGILIFAVLVASWSAYTVSILMEERDNLVMQASAQEQQMEVIKKSSAQGLTPESFFKFYSSWFRDLRLSEEYERAKRYQRPFSCLLASVDAYPELEKRYPVLAEGLLAAEIAQFIKKNMRLVDIVIQDGKHQCFIILPETGISGARISAERLRFNAEKQVFKVGNTALHLTISVAAIAFDPSVHLKQNDILNSLQQLLLTAKPKGPNRVLALAEEGI